MTGAVDGQGDDGGDDGGDGGSDGDGTRRVTVQPGEETFEVVPGRTILESALGAGVALAYGCSNGSCGECRARVVTGEVREVRFHDFALREAERARGVALMCACTARTDLVVEAVRALHPGELPAQHVRARVIDLDRTPDGVAVVTLKIMRGNVFRFFAGQRARFCAPGTAPRVLPIASCPCDGSRLELHLPPEGDDPFDRWLLETGGRGGRIDVDGPFGRFVLDEARPRPLALLAFGAGFAPMRSLIEHAMNRELDEPIALVRWPCDPPGPDAARPYLHNQCRAWVDALDEMIYRVAEPGDLAASLARAMAWLKAPGQVPLASRDVYVAGSAAQCEAAAAALRDAGALAQRIRVEVVG